MTTTIKLWSLMTAAVMALCLTACSENNDNEEPVSPTPQVPTGNKFTIAPTGGTVETGTLKMEIPSGTFSEEKALYVDNAGNIQELKDVAASDFYKLTLPATTQKPIRISVRSQQASDGCLMVVRSAGRATSGGEQQDFCVPIEKVAYSGDTFTAELPTLEGGDGMAEVTVGLITTESAEAATRTGDTYSDITVMLPYANRSIKVEVTSQTLYYDVAKTRILREKFIPQALHKLDSIGFRLDADRETIPIEIVAYWYKEKREGLWGQHICSKLTKHWDCVQINGEKLVNMTTQEEQDELAKTLIHELGHYFQTDYDKRRSQWSKATESPGAYYALMEASSVWTEHYFGAPLSSIVVDNGRDFLLSGLWNCSESNYDTHGYGMAVLFTYLVKQFGDLSLMSIFNDYKTGKDADVCLTNYSKAHNFRIDDIDWYNDFLRATAEGSVIDKYDMGGLTAKSWGVNDEALHTNTITLNRYGMAVRSLYLLEGANIDGKQINLGEEEKGTYTEVYRADYEFSRVQSVLSTVSNITYLGRISHDTQLTITDSLSTMFKKQRLFFVTLQDPQQSHQISVPSKLTYQLCDPQPTLSVSETNASFTANGGEKQITVTSNCTNVSVTEKPSWCSASISGNTLTLKAEKNTTEEKRDGKIIVKASNNRGSIEVPIIVEQEKKAKQVEYAGAIVKLTLNTTEELFIPSLGGRAAAGTTSLHDDGSFEFTSSGTDSGQPSYMDIPGMGWTLTFITTSTWNISIKGVNTGGGIKLDGYVSQHFDSKTITHNKATGAYIKTESTTSDISFNFKEVREPAILSTGLNNDCPYWFSYTAWRAKGATLSDFSQYVQDFNWVKTTVTGTEQEQPLSLFGGRNLAITIGLWEDDNINIPAGRGD
jgi:hypothetical protein